MTTTSLRGPTKPSTRKPATKVARKAAAPKKAAKSPATSKAGAMLRELQGDLDALNLRVEKMRQRFA